jgi:hypothetical protein
MRRLTVALAVLALSIQFGTTLLDACGAKFLVATGSVFWQRSQRTTHPADILLYQHSRDKEIVEFVAKLRAMLKEMGHEVTVADGEAALRADAGGKFTVVMLKLDEARRLKPTITSALPKASILPMDVFLKQPEIAVAKQEFGRILVLPATPREVFSTVDTAYR